MFDVADFILAAEAVLGIGAERLIPVTKIALAESALAAPFATYGGIDFYPGVAQRAAILASRIMRNHPLPDGNKRVALILADAYLDEHGLILHASAHEIDRTFRACASREAAEDYFVMWFETRVRVP